MQPASRSRSCYGVWWPLSVLKAASKSVKLKTPCQRRSSGHGNVATSRAACAGENRMQKKQPLDERVKSYRALLARLILSDLESVKAEKLAKKGKEQRPDPAK